MNSEAEVQTQAVPRTPAFAMLRALAGIATVSGLLVVLVFKLTAPRIEQNQREAIERAIYQVVPGAVVRRDFVAVGEALLSADKNTPGERLYAAYDASGALRGIALQAMQQGYQDVIKLLYGYDPNCQCITGIKVLKMAETPGLGDKIAFDPAFLANFHALDAALDAAGNDLRHPIVAVKHGSKSQPWQIDAISGATVSSVAVAKALHKSAQKMAPLIQKHRALLQSPPQNLDSADAPY
jgi:electron transport complex protein RnfG